VTCRSPSTAWSGTCARPRSSAGDPPSDEEPLTHPAGYRGSSPVLVGNGAGDQLQLDGSGEIIDSVYLLDKDGSGISHGDWENLCTLVDWLREHWDQPDESIWETRGGRGDHVHSRLMCWVALEPTRRCC
jgi:GH15 family glucan-1,4-alpha-glucosidase